MLRNQSQQPEWTPALGLRRGVFRLLIKAPICIAIWAAFVFFTAPATNWLASYMGGLGLPGISILVVVVVFVVAGPCGHLLSRKLNDHLGFDGLVPAAMGIVVAWLVAFSGTKVALLLTDADNWVTALCTIAMGFESSIVVLWRTWVNPPD